jgi:hypothetical protein
LRTASGRWGLRAAALLLGLLTAACGAMTATRSGRSAVEQGLLVRSLERAVGALDTSKLVGQRVALELFGLTDDREFARQLLSTRLRARGVDLVDDPKAAQLRIRAFASILGVDQGDTLIGVPALQVPVVSLPVPEIALFKWMRSRGHTELQMFVFDPASDRFLERIPDGVGRSRYDRFTVLLVFGFTWSDLDEAPADRR